MGGIIKEFLTDLINSAITTFDGMLASMYQDMLRIECMLGTVVTSDEVISAYNYIYWAAVTFITLKFMIKGFQIYILWRNGDADSSPQTMLIGAVEGAVVMVGFPAIYDILVDAAMQLTTAIMALLGLTNPEEQLAVNVVGDLLFLIAVLVYFVLAFGMMVKLIRQGVELLVMRLGVPLACIGLIDSDGGIFTTYMQTLFRAVLTSMVQVLLFSLSIRYLAAGAADFNGILLAIAAMIAAFNTPVLMQQILIPYRGSGAMNKVYMGSMIVKTLRGPSGGGG